LACTANQDLMQEDDTSKEYANGVSNQFVDGNLQKK
jgi:hypothetical protein